MVIVVLNKVQETLMNLLGPPNGPCEANLGGPLPIKDPPGSLHGPNWSIIDLRTMDKLKIQLGLRSIGHLVAEK